MCNLSIVFDGVKEYNLLVKVRRTVKNRVEKVSTLTLTKLKKYAIIVVSKKERGKNYGTVL